MFALRDKLSRSLSATPLPSPRGSLKPSDVVSPSPIAGQKSPTSTLNESIKFLQGVATRYVDGVLTKYEAAEGVLQLQGVMEVQDEVMCLRYSPDGSLLAVGLADGVIKIYATENYQVLGTLKNAKIGQDELPATCIRFPTVSKFTDTKVGKDKTLDRRNILLSSYTTGFVRYWHHESGECLSEIDEKRPTQQTTALDLNCTMDSFATVGADPQIFLYDLQTRQRLMTMEPSGERNKMDGHMFRVFAVQFHPVDPNVLLTGGWDDTVHYWDTRQKQSVRHLYGPHICGDALDIDIKRGEILTGSWRKEQALQIWDFGSGEKIADVPEEGRGAFTMLYCAQWFGKDNIVCGGSHRNRAKVIDRATFTIVGTLGELPQAVYCLDSNHSDTKPQLSVGALRNVYVTNFTKILPSTTSAHEKLQSFGSSYGSLMSTAKGSNSHAFETRSNYKKTGSFGSFKYSKTRGSQGPDKNTGTSKR